MIEDETFTRQAFCQYGAPLIKCMFRPRGRRPNSRPIDGRKNQGFLCRYRSTSPDSILQYVSILEAGMAWHQCRCRTGVDGLVSEDTHTEHQHQERSRLKG